MRLAIFGASCSGKSSVSERIAEHFSLPVRHCGHAVKAWADAQDLTDPSRVPPHAHKMIDKETVEFALKVGGILDGCFLNYVLFGIPDLFLIELTCSFEERSRRLAKRHGLQDGQAKMRARDRADDGLRAQLYDGHPNQPPIMQVDTTLGTVEWAMGEVLQYLDRGCG